MNISPSESLKKLPDEHEENTEDGAPSKHLLSLLTDGANAPVTGEADAQYFARLREDATNHLAQQC